MRTMEKMVWNGSFCGRPKYPAKWQINLNPIWFMEAQATIGRIGLTVHI